MILSSWVIFLVVCAVGSSLALAWRGSTHSIPTKQWRFTARSGLYAGNNDVTEFDNRKDVDRVLAEIMTVLEPLKVSPAPGESANLTVEDMRGKFESLLASLRQSTTLPAQDKMTIFAEASMMFKASTEDIRANVDDFSYSKSFPGIPVDKPATAVYSPARAPVVVVHGPGPVGQQVMEILKSLSAGAKAASFKVLNGKLLSTIQESELAFMVRDAQSIIVAADGVPIVKKGWFGLKDEVAEAEPVLNSKGLKRLLNAIMNDMKRTATEDVQQQGRGRGGRGGLERQGRRVKVVALGKASRPARSVVSLLTGDTTDFESEVVLLCRQRGLDCNLVKTGRLIADDEEIPSNVRSRSPYQLRSETVSSSSSGVEDDMKLSGVVARPRVESPVVLHADSRVVESSECTRQSVAAEALLRAAVHPHRNASIVALSNPFSMDSNVDVKAGVGAEGGVRHSIMPTDEEWQDELLKLDGPELLRFPLRYASTRQALNKLRRITTALERIQQQQRQQNAFGGIGSSLVGAGDALLPTPFEVQRCANGVRIVFRPLRSSYRSAREERLLQQEGQGVGGAEAKESERMLARQAKGEPANPARPSGYLSPEEQKRLDVAATEAASTSTSTSAAGTGTGTGAGKGSSISQEGGAGRNGVGVALEGGVELIVESTPYIRVRARRCCMGPQTPPQLESEATLLRVVERGLQELDTDYRILLSSDLWQQIKL